MKSIFFLLFTVVFLSASDSCNNSKCSHYNKAEESEVISVRLATRYTSGTINLNHDNYAEADVEKEIGLELSLVVQERIKKGFFIRPVFTFMAVNGMNSNLDTNTLMFLYEYELGKKYNKHIELFTGINAGIGNEKISYKDYSESLLAAQVGISVGVSGLFHQNLGYYLKITTSYRTHTPSSYSETINHTLTNTSLGFSYTY